MKALTIKQPWAYAIAMFGKTVENRSRKPPKALIGQRIAIHVSKNADDWNAFCDGEILDTPAHLQAMRAWERECAPFGDFGCIIATARIVGFCEWRGGFMPNEMQYIREHKAAVMTAPDSPWWIGPVGIVLADIRLLNKPIGPMRGALGYWEVPAEFLPFLEG